MEVRKHINTGVLNWTPAPLRTSLPGSATSDDGAEDSYRGGDGDDVEEEVEDLGAEDFEGYMDENGIIGLRETLEDVELCTKEEDEDAGTGAWAISTEACAEPEEPFSGPQSEGESVPPATLTNPSGGKVTSNKYPTLKNMSTFSRSHRLHTASTPSPCLSSPPSTPRSYTYPHLLHFSSEELAQSVGIEAETLPDGDGFTESMPESICCSSSSCSHHMSPVSKPHQLPDIATMDIGPAPALVEGEVNCKQTKNAPERAPTGDPKRETPGQRRMREYSPGTSTSRSSNLPEKPCRPAWSIKYRAALEHQHPPNTPQAGRIGRAPRERSRKIPRTFAKKEQEVRREPQSFRTPDFSKVEPKVYFPKGGYEPPKSRSSSRVRMSPEPTLVFKSPADIAKEILFSSTEAPPSPSPSPTPSGTEQNTTISIVPEDFRCPHQATRLVEQLQEDYNRLLTRFAEAENTIDRLRLKAKVNLYSDPKRPDQSLQSRMNREGSKVLTLSFPQAQTAVMGSHSWRQNRPEETQRSSPDRPCSGSSGSSRGSCGATESPSRTLTKQANKFLQQVKIFEELITSRKLEPFERLKGLSRLVQGLDLLEKGYLTARDERRQLQRRVAEVGPFDPNRVLEGLIFQCGTCVEELRELSEQKQYSCMAPPSPIPRPSTVCQMSLPSERLSPPQSPAASMQCQLGPVTGMEMSIADGESGGETEGEEHLLLRPFRRDELDCSSLMDSYQSFQDLPAPAQVQTRGPRRSPRGPRPPQDREGARPGRAQAGLSRRHSTTNSDEDDDDRATPTKLGTDQSERPSLKAADQSQNRSPPGQSAIPSGQQQQPDLQPRRWKVGRYPSSSLTSLGESGGSETKSSKLGRGSKRLMSQDGIISPETDSGFLGSDGTPAAAISPLHQRATESSSLPQTRIPRRHRAGSLSVQVSFPLPPTVTASSSSPPPPAPQEHSISGGVGLGNNGLSRRPMKGGQQERRRDSTACASQRLVGPMPQTVAGSGASELGLELDRSCSVSECNDDDEGQRTEGSRGGHSLFYRHDDPHSTPSPGGLTLDHNLSEAMLELQVEVDRLKERLESSLRTRRSAQPPQPAGPPGPPSPPQPTRTFPAAPTLSTSTPRVSSGRSRVDGGGGGGRRQGEGGQPAWTRSASSAPTERARREGGLQPGIWSGSSGPSADLHAFHQHSPLQLGPSAQRGMEAPEGTEVCAACGLSEPTGRVDPPTVHRWDPRCVFSGPQPGKGGTGGPGPTTLAPPLPGSLGLVHWLSACHPALLFCSCAMARSDSQPPCVHTQSQGHATSEVRGRGEVSGYRGHPLVAKKRDPLSFSLNKAIRAAKDMKLTSRRMARSLASGLHYQETLSQSCIY